MPELAVLVPVLGRPANVEPLIDSFALGCTDAQLWFIADRNDLTERAELDRFVAPMNDIKVLVMDRDRPTSWPEKINAGVRTARADWYLSAADDVRFTPGWWEATASLRADPTVGVIGTNDSLDGTGNGAVAEGSHTCHPLIRATYIRDFGTWDGPGRAVSDEYHHWYVDNELVITAKQRKAWAFCRDAVIEHIHPYWFPDAVSWDATYTLGESRNLEDRDTWFRRAATNGPL